MVVWPLLPANQPDLVEHSSSHCDVRSEAQTRGLTRLACLGIMFLIDNASARGSTVTHAWSQKPVESLGRHTNTTQHIRVSGQEYWFQRFDPARTLVLVNT
jgi:hypothetical protein